MTARRAKRVSGGPHVVTAKDILPRLGYCERINEFYLADEGSRPGIATHDVLLHHDAALRAAAKTKAEERFLNAYFAVPYCDGDKVARAARAVLRERAAKEK